MSLVGLDMVKGVLPSNQVAPCKDMEHSRGFYYRA